MRLVAEVIKDVSEMPLEAQNQVSALLLRLRRQRDDEWRRHMAEKIDDRDPTPLAHPGPVAGRTGAA